VRGCLAGAYRVEGVLRMSEAAFAAWLL
jgi:hypothetical protein